MKLANYKLDGWNENKIRKQKKIGQIRIILLSLDGVSPKEGRKNLIAIDKNDEILWIADLPSMPYDSYHDMNHIDGIICGRSSNSFIAEIDVLTGGILRKYIEY